MKKITYQEKQKLRKWVIFNTYGDKKLASKYARKSDKAILNELGIDLTRRKTYTEKQLTERQINNRKKNYEKFGELVLSGYEPIEARRYSKSKYSFKAVREIAVTKEKIKKIITGGNLTVIDLKKQIVINERAKRLMNERRRQWSLYSLHPKGHPELTFPPFLKDVADYLNLELYKGDIGSINRNFGYAVLNYVYVKGYDFKTAIEVFELDDSFSAGRGYGYKPPNKV